MGVKKKRRMTAVLAVIWCILLSVIPVFGAGDDYRIEQLYINMPDVTAYYRSSQGDNKLEAYLGGRKLHAERCGKFFENRRMQVEY